jgi:hypothetical protein
MAYLVASVTGLLFGAADQYFGSRISLLPWSAGISGMSALWLALPFVVGMTQTRARKAMVLGLIATLAALVGYIAMTYSPLEGIAHERFLGGVLRMATTGYNPFWVLGGIVSGPFFGLLGQRWRVDRSWLSATAVTGAFCLEPLALRSVGMLWTPVRVWIAEIAFGVALGVTFAVVFAISRRTRPSVAPIPPNA